MKAELRTNSNGEKYYSFVYYDRVTKKTKRISKTEIRRRFGRDITDHDKAVEACKLLAAEFDSLKKRIELRIAWESEFYSFSQLLEFYEAQQIKKAPNSFKNNVHYLKYYVLPFFLSIKKCNNITMWFNYYTEFKDWLEDEARLIMRPEQKISYASKNHAISALNTFMHGLFRRRTIDRYFACESFPEHSLNEKGIDDIIKNDEMEHIYARLKQDGHLCEAVFFRFLYFTGMRFNEALGVHPGNLYEGVIEDRILTKHLEQEKLSYFGYVVIDSQPSHENRGLRDKSGVIHRKPLKGRARINDKSARTVIIMDKTLWNDLVSIHNGTLSKHEAGFFGKKIDQYPLFEGIERTTSTRRLQNAYERCGLRYRSWHCCRHTRATMLIGETANTFLARLWLGHSSERVLKRYVHIYESVIRAAKKNRTEDSSTIRRLKAV